MSFLRRFLAALLKITQIATGIEPVVVSDIGSSTKISAITDDLTRITTIVQNGAAIVSLLKQNLTPEQEATALSPLISQELLKSELLIGRKVKDEVLFSKGSTDLALAVREILESIE